MPRYRVVSGEVIATNGNAPYTTTVWAADPQAAALKAKLVKGEIEKITFIEGDLENLTYSFLVVNSKKSNFRVVVQEVFNWKFWKRFSQ